MERFKVHGETDFAHMRRQAAEMAAELEALRIVNRNLVVQINAGAEKIAAVEEEARQVGALLIAALRARFGGRLLVTQQEVESIPPTTRLQVFPPRHDGDPWQAVVIEDVSAPVASS